MKNLIIFAVAGQVLDVLTTKIGVERFGCKEESPLVRSLVEKGRFGILTAVKIGSVGIVYLVEKGNKERRNLLLANGLLGFGASIWNIRQMKKYIKASSEAVRQVSP